MLPTGRNAVPRMNSDDRFVTRASALKSVVRPRHPWVVNPLFFRGAVSTTALALEAPVFRDVTDKQSLTRDRACNVDDTLQSYLPPTPWQMTIRNVVEFRFSAFLKRAKLSARSGSCKPYFQFDRTLKVAAFDLLNASLSLNKSIRQLTKCSTGGSPFNTSHDSKRWIQGQAIVESVV